MTGIAGVILHKNRRVLLQHRDDLPHVAYAGFWGIFGGHVEPGEEPEQGAKREIQEELGLQLDGALELIHHSLNRDEVLDFYLAPLEVPLEGLILMEGQGMALLSTNQLADLKVVPHHMPAILKALELLAET